MKPKRPISELNQFRSEWFVRPELEKMVPLYNRQPLMAENLPYTIHIRRIALGMKIDAENDELMWQLLQTLIALRKANFLDPKSSKQR